MTDVEGFFEGLEQARDVAERASRRPDSEARWALLGEITELMSSPIDRFDRVVETVLETIVRLTGADRGFIMLFDEPEADAAPGGLRVVSEYNVDLGALPEEARRVSRSIVDEVVRSERGIAIADMGEMDRFGDAASIQQLRLLSVMCVPLFVRVREARARSEQERRERGPEAGRRVMGVIYVDSRSVTTSFGEGDLALFQALANVASTALLHADVFRRATTDRLTGLLTRRRTAALLREELRLATKQGSPLSVLLADVDGLRRVNAEQGYAAGDAVLETVARCVRARTRQEDHAGRWGAEEFLLVLPGTDREGAEEVARKILLAAQREGISLSIGVATARPEDSGAEALVRRADQALGQAKREGGGRTRVWNPSLARSRPPRADKLAGVFSGDPGDVYRNVLLLLERLPAVHAAGSLDAVLSALVESAVELARAERGFLLLREGGGKPAVRLGRDRSGAAAEASSLRMPLVERALRTGEPVAAEAEGTLRSPVLCAPLRVGNAPALGAIYVEAAPGQGFAPGTLAFLDEFARQGAIAVDNARLLAENLDKTRKIEKLMHALEQERTRTERRLETTAQIADVTVVEDNRRQLETRYRYDNIVGRSPAMRRVFRMLDKVTASMVPVFIHGESGTGKELVAKAIHFNSPRKHRPFIAENCGAVAETLLESELFGYVKGAFTGAHADRKGLFELAHGGTVLLDEVGEMTPAMQTKLLRVLQEGEIRRVGGKETIRIDVRIISASNRDIRKLVDEGTFREDLFYRLNVVRIDLPPLRERKGDVPLLVEHFLRQATERGEPRYEVSPEALEILNRYNWPGNVRELANVIERARILAEGNVIGPEAILLDSGPIDLGARVAGGAGAAGGKPSGTLAPSFPATGSSLTASPGTPLGTLLYELNDRQRRLIEYLQVYGTIRNRDYYEIMGVSKSTGWRDLKDLIEREIVHVQGKGKSSVYSLRPEFVELLGRASGTA